MIAAVALTVARTCYRYGRRRHSNLLCGFDCTTAVDPTATTTTAVALTVIVAATIAVISASFCGYSVAQAAVLPFSPPLLLISC